MTQPSFFDLDDGRKRRDEALDHFEDHFRSAAFVEEARRTAFAIAGKNGYVTTDDLHTRLEVPHSVHHNVWGSVLRSPYFIHVGEVQSKRPEAKARWIHKWVIGPAWKRYL